MRRRTCKGHTYKEPKLDKKWEEMFAIKLREEEETNRTIADKFLGIVGLDGNHSRSVWHVVDKRTKETIGSYQDRDYAIKQAKHKHRKIMNSIERMLLG